MEIASGEEQPALEMVRPSDAVVKLEEGKDEEEIKPPSPKEEESKLAEENLEDENATSLK